MIDFKLNNIGDINFTENKKSFPKFKIDFDIADRFPKLKVDFHIKQRPAKNNGLKIDFLVAKDQIEHGKQYIPCVRDDEEKAQYISIRLKTELNEMPHYYNSFGSELIRLRHTDLKNIGNHDLAKEYVANAISDIISTENQNMSVYRKITKDGKLQAATLGIDIYESPYKKIYEYEI